MTDTDRDALTSAFRELQDSGRVSVIAHSDCQILADIAMAVLRERGWTDKNAVTESWQDGYDSGFQEGRKET